MPAEIVGATLQQRDFRRPSERGGNQRQILREELILQRAGTSRDEYASARQQRGHEVCEGLSRACSRLDDERLAMLERTRDALGHAQLLTAEPEVRKRALQGAFGPEYL